MTRGFVTIATGKQRYYEIAANLLASYRHFTANPLPFAIICDAENEYTALFDDVIVIDDPCRSYVDKIFLPCYVPYDETIFIDADCLAYKDLNDLWEVFENQPDFSVLGKSYPPDYRYAWFKREDVAEYAEAITFIPDFIGGVYFMRNTNALREFANTSLDILSHYHRYTFRQFENPCDEPVFALATAVHGFKPADRDRFPICFYPHAITFESDIEAGWVAYDSRYDSERAIHENPYLVHWGSGNTALPPYTIEVAKLRHAMGLRGAIATNATIARIKGREAVKGALAKLHLLNAARTIRDTLKGNR